MPVSEIGLCDKVKDIETGFEGEVWKIENNTATVVNTETRLERKIKVWNLKLIKIGG